MTCNLLLHIISKGNQIGGMFMEFTSSKFVVIKSFLTTMIGSLVFGFIVFIFTNNEQYALIASAVLIVLFLLVSISEWRFRLEVDNNHLYEYRGSRLKQDIDLNGASMSSRTKQGGNNIGVDCKLEITNGDMISYVDCTPLGKREYYRFLEMLGFNDEPIVLETHEKQ